MEPWELSQGYLEINRHDLRENARRVTEAVDCPVIGVVKCDGYGVSAVEAAAAQTEICVKGVGLVRIRRRIFA